MSKMNIPKVNQEVDSKSRNITEENNSLPQDTSVNVTFPRELQVELVQANEIRNYEIFQWLATAMVSIGFGFWTSFFLSSLPFDNLGQRGLLFSAIVFTVFSTGFIFLALRHRKRAFSKTVRKSVSLDEFKNKKSKN